MAAKIFPHCMGGTPDGKAMALKANGAKLVDDFGMANELPAGAFVLGRRILVDPFDGNKPVTAENRMHMTPVDAANNVFALMRQQAIDPNPKIEIWEILNEPVLGDDPEAYKWFTLFNIEIMKLVEAIGLKCVIFNFSAGTPDQKFWPYLLPAVKYARDHGHYLGLHEYGSVWMWWMTGSFQVIQPGEAWFTWPGAMGYTTLLYRRVYKNFLEPAGLGDCPLLITECGLDAVGPSAPGFTAGNWRFCAGQWGSWDGSRDPIDYWRGAEKDAGRYYAEQLIWYDREVRRDPYVRAWFLYTQGQTSDAWRDYDTNGTRVTQYLLDYMVQVSGEQDPALPPPAETPPVSRFANGDRVEVVSQALLVRTAPSLSSVAIGYHPPGARGTVAGDFVYADGIPWRKILYDSGLWGYSSENFLEKVAQQPKGETMLDLNGFNSIDLTRTYVWDQGNASLPPDQQGNTILVPVGLNFGYVWDPGVRVTWTDRKAGSPTLGQIRAQPTANLKPECVIMNPFQASDVRAGSPYTGNLIKCFKGWGALWVEYFAPVHGLIVGAKYRLRWPVFPDLVMKYLDGNKIFADDPDAGFVRLRVLPGDARPPLGENPDSSWYDGGDFALGQWKVLEILFDAPVDVMTLAWEGISTFGLENSCFFLAQPTLELISTSDQPNTQPMEGTVMDAVRAIGAANAAIETNFATLKAAVTKFTQMMGN